MEEAAESQPLATESLAKGDTARLTEAEKVVAETESDIFDDRCLLKGRVPQAQDWLDAWAESTEHVSFHKQARILGKKGRLRHNNLRRMRIKQIRVIAEVKRSDIRKQLREAQFISISMDDRKYEKLLRFRSDAPSEPFVHRGILGVMSLDKSAVGDFEEDHALIAVRKMDGFLNRICTPLGPGGRKLATDIALKEHIRKCIRVFAADGASKERRALFLAAKELCPNIVLVLRDGAHALRIAVRDPLHFDSLFGEVWTHLFDQRHALVPDVMNSKKWQDLLQQIQRQVLKNPGVDQPLAVVLKHMRFAKQRFDSTADPIAKVAFMLLPLATMLAYIGSDERHKLADRQRAKELLKKLDSKFSLAIGVSADWGLVTQAFLRLFDRTAHDIAKTYSEINEFKKVMRILFVEGGVFSSRDRSLQRINKTKLPAIGGYFGTKGVKPMFVTQWIEKMLRNRAVFNCGGEQVLLWGPPKEDDVKEVVGRLKFITAHVIDRVEAEFGHLKHFSCFDVPTLRAAFTCADKDKGKELQQSLHRYIRTLAKDLSADPIKAALEYRELAPLIVNLTSAKRPLALSTNVEVWSSMLAGKMVCMSDFPQRKEMQALQTLIRFYISIEDGECAIERDLGVLQQFQSQHKNASTDLLDDIMLAKDAVIKPAAICIGASLGPSGRRWATLWRAMYGARLGCYRKAQHGKRGKRPGTYEAAKAGVLAAAEYAVQTNSKKDWLQRQGGDDDVVIPLGIRKSVLKSAIGDNAEQYSNAATKRFQKLTQTKKLGANPFFARSIQHKWTATKAAKPALPLENIKSVCYLGEVGESLPCPAREGVEEMQGRRRCLLADLAVVEDLGHLHDALDDATVNQVLAIVGRGLPVVTRTSWSLARGDPDQVPKESVIRNRPLATTVPCVFEYDAHFKARSMNLLNTLTALSNLPNSKWKVRCFDGGVANTMAAVGANAAAVGAKAAADGAKANHDKGHEIVTLNGTLNGVDVVRCWVQKHRRVSNVLGSKAWTLTGVMI